VELSDRIGQFRHPMLVKRSVKHTTLIMITSDRGLCGGLNLGVINKTYQFLKGMEKDSVSIITIGKKGRDALMRLGYTVTADFSGLAKTTFNEVLPITQMIFQDFLNHKTDSVVIAYTHYINTIKQKPIIKTLLPLSRENLISVAMELLGKEKSSDVKARNEYIIEPSPQSVLSTLIPRFSEMQVYQAVLEARASEHCARMVAMKNATDAATDIIEDLTLTGNQMRQSGITQEISEIVSAGEAMKG
jgi:F-type H+-transporting ATPase subunit gamma